MQQTVEAISRAGNDEQLRELYVDHYATVQRFLQKRTNNAALAEDLAAETFCQAAATLQRRPECRLEVGWLMTVARRRLCDHLRREYRQREAVDQHQPRNQWDASMESRFDDDVLDALRKLPERQRAALVYRYILDLTVSQVATHVGCTYDSADALLYRGRKRFASEFA